MTEELKRKQQRLDELAILISLANGKILTTEQKMTEENERYKLEFNLSELVKECKSREMDFKIKAMENIIKAVKK